MLLTFLGADHEVTGSRTLLECGPKRALVDCGMEQGSNRYKNADMPVDPAQIDYVFLTHAHIDHTGHLPLLYKQGFRGRVYATRETCNLCEIMLRDSAHIQQSEAEYATRKAIRAGRPPEEPLYTLEDAEGVLKLFRPVEYGQAATVDENFAVRFTDVGHLLGSASVEIWLTDGDTERKVLFSGDIGNTDQPIIRDPQPVEGAPYVVMESTYGDRTHEKRREGVIPALASYIQDTLDAGGNVVIPSFAVGRTQEILYFLREIKEKGMVKGHDGFPVYVDSPLANEATAIFLQCGTQCLDEDARAVMARGENPLVFPGLHTFVTTEESRRLNTDPEPKVIISAGGMCDAGRVRHHLKHNLWREESLILFVGYQANGTLGRAIYEGAKKVKLFGEEIAVNARVELLPGVSGHADKQGLVNWLTEMKQRPERVFLNHGDDGAMEALRVCLSQEHGYAVDAPYSGSVFDLRKGEWSYIAQPELAPAKTRTRAKPDAMARLLAAAKRVTELAERYRGAADREIERFAEALERICEKWKR